MADRLRMDDPDFGAMFADIRRSWFRLETLQHYDVTFEREPYDAFHSGRPMPHDPGDDEWTAMIQAHREAGRSLSRVHVITEPLTPYIEYELAWGYKAGHDGGEDIRLIVCPAGSWPEGVPADHDFWFLDDELWIMHYEDGGRAGFVERVSDPITVQQHHDWRVAALATSISLDSYLGQRRDLAARSVQVARAEYRPAVRARVERESEDERER